MRENEKDLCRTDRVTGKTILPDTLPDGIASIDPRNLAVAQAELATGHVDDAVKTIEKSIKPTGKFTG